MTIKDSLSGITNYPIPPTVIENAVEDNGLDDTAIATQEVRASKLYQLALAEVYDFLATAPTVQQSGVVITISDSQRLIYSDKAQSIRSKFDIEDDTVYGYQDENLYR